MDGWIYYRVLVLHLMWEDDIEYDDSDGGG